MALTTCIAVAVIAARPGTVAFGLAECHLAVDVPIADDVDPVGGVALRARPFGAGYGRHRDARAQRMPYVVAVQPGLLSSVDLPLTIPRNAFAGQ
jgi:hypothetical protein